MLCYIVFSSCAYVGRSICSHIARTMIELGEFRQNGNLDVYFIVLLSRSLTFFHFSSGTYMSTQCVYIGHRRRTPYITYLPYLQYLQLIVAIQILMLSSWQTYANVDRQGQCPSPQRIATPIGHMRNYGVGTPSWHI